MITIDPDNLVVTLCILGMQAEQQSNYDEAHKLFQEAWQTSTDDFEACIAAHYLARHQEKPEEILRWNQEALTRAQAVGDEQVSGFFPSLYLNLGYSFELLGNLAEANNFYGMADSKLAAIPDDSYSQIVRQGLKEGLKRLNASSE